MMFARCRLIAAMLIALLVISILSACSPSPTPEVIEVTRAIVATPTPVTGAVAEAQIQATAGGMVELDDGAQVVVPPGVLQTDQWVTLARLDSKPVGGEGTFSLPGQIYEVQAEQEVFDLPIEITLPYDERLIPADRTEGEVFAVFLYEGQWHRVDGHVDTVANTITVEVLHVSIWTWATDTIDNALKVIKKYFESIDEDDIDTIGEAEALVEERRRIAEEAWDEADFAIERWEETVDVKEVIYEAAGKITLHASHHIVAALGGKAAVLTVGGAPVAVWGGAFLGTLYYLRITEAGGEALAAVTKVRAAEARLQEAEAILWALKHPDAKTGPPHYVEALDRAVAEITTTTEEVEPAEELTAEPTEEPTAEPTEEPTAEPTEEPVAEPTEEPAAEPAEEPTVEPAEEPTAAPPTEQNYLVANDMNGIYIQAIGGDEKTYIVTGQAIHPVWSPDGTTIAFGCPADNQFGWEVCLANRDGTDIRCVTTGTKSSTEPNWLPDGQSLFVASYREESTDIWQINLYDNTWINITPGTPDSHEHCPGLVEGYEQIVFNSDRECISDLGCIAVYISNRDGSDVRLLRGSVTVVDQTYYPWRTKTVTQ